MNCSETVERLNRLHRILDLAISTKRLYRISRIKSLFEIELKKASQQFNLNKLNAIEDMEALIGYSPKLRTIIDKKTKAYLNHNYEEAAQYRDQEISYFYSIMEEKGYTNTNIFYCKDSEIFYR